MDSKVIVSALVVILTTFVYFYFIRIPHSERALDFHWIAPIKATLVLLPLSVLEPARTDLSFQSRMERCGNGFSLAERASE